MNKDKNRPPSRAFSRGPGNRPRPRNDRPADPRVRAEAAPARDGGAPRGKDRDPRNKDGAPRDRDSAPRDRDSAPRNRDSAPHSRESAPRSREEVWVYGYHPVAAALANPARKILRVVATTEAAARLREDGAVPAEAIARLRTMGRHEIDQLVGGEAVHQGVALLARPLEHDLRDVLEGLSGKAEACLVLLDQVTDPHNVGAVLRSAAAFGASAVIAPDRHAPEESGAMAKSASGALDKVPYIKTVNLVRAIELIKEFQFWLVGLDAEAESPLAKIKLGGRIALVLGAEGEGIRRLVAESCDHLAKLPIAADMESLNVSNAAAVALYEKARQRV